MYLLVAYRFALRMVAPSKHVEGKQRKLCCRSSVTTRWPIRTEILQSPHMHPDPHNTMRISVRIVDVPCDTSLEHETNTIISASPSIFSAPFPLPRPPPPMCRPPTGRTAEKNKLRTVRATEEDRKKPGGTGMGILGGHATNKQLRTV